ncbi:MAG: patatin-like phospholipase family protein [Elusimicrobia bacterium]|nr:patatin-like phospholipase family protein [Elusimicrobiota bacterium]
MSLPLRRPTGLILAGGGSLGSWQSGFLSRLIGGHGARFDQVLGISTGALCAAAYALDRLDVLTGLWRDISKARVLRWSPRLSPPTMFGNDSLWEIVSHGGPDEEARARLRVPLTVAVTERGTGRRRYARFTPRGTDGWDGPLADHLVASCSIPDIFPPVSLRVGERSAQFVDGGQRGEPPDFSCLAACRDIVVVEMFRPEEARAWPPLNPVRLREHFVRRGQLRYIEQGLATLRTAQAPPRLLRARPSGVLDFSLIRFDTAVCGPAFALGEADADAFSAEALQTVEMGPSSQEGPEMLFSKGLSP